MSLADKLPIITDGAGAAPTGLDMPAGLSRVVADHPAAVLLVDLDSREVVFANALAAQLAPSARLPLDAGEWSRLAGLNDSTGETLEDSASSLQRIAAGTPVAGEQVTALRSSDVSEAREDLWVIGMPLSDAPAPLNRRALVVFLPLRDQTGIDQAQRSSFELQHRAVISSEVSFSISDPHADDDPLVWVNPAFEAVTGYRKSDVLGTNCRFLQGPATDRAAVQRIRDGLAEGGTVTETLLNYRADGSAFWNHIVISPIFDADGRLTHHVGVQSDVTERVEADRERDRALAAAEAANTRLAALAAISSELSNGLETGEATFTRLAAVVATHFDGWVLASALTDIGAMDEISVAHSDPARSGDAALVQQTLRQRADSLSRALNLPDLLKRLSGSSPLHGVVTEKSRDAALAALGSDLAAQPLPTDGIVGSAFAVTPITARGRHIGALLLLRDSERGRFDMSELAAITDLGVRAGVGLDNARLYAREHDAALTLQRSLLPRLPELDGFEVAATYQPAHNQAEVGGDWYDVLNLPDSHGIGIAVGDVMGHDLRAAAAMGQLRSVLRSYAWSGDQPSDVIAHLDELVRGLDMAAMATCAYGIVCAKDDDCDVTYTLAGHLPPLIRHPDGQIETLDAARTSPIGVSGPAHAVPQAVTQLPPGATLVLYTDGLIERRDRDIDAGIDLLRDTIRNAPDDSTAEDLCKIIVTTLTSPEHDDDLCVLVLRRVP